MKTMTLHRKTFDLESISDVRVRESVRTLLKRYKDHAAECAKWHREARGDLMRIERKYNVMARSTRAYFDAVREASR